MADVRLPLPADLGDDDLVAYLNRHVDTLRRAFDLDVSWAYIRATVEAVRVVGASPSGGGLRIRYEYDYSAYCACKDLSASDTQTDSVVCEVRDGTLVVAEFVPPERSTLDEF